MRLLCIVYACLIPASLGQDYISPPGMKPTGFSSHFITGARVVIRPGQELEKAALWIENGRIRAIGPELQPPEKAQLHDLTGCTVYAGFIEPHWAVDSAATREVSGPESPPVASEVDDLTSGAGSGFLGVRSAAGEPGTTSLVKPDHLVATHYSPNSKSLESLRAEGFTVANAVPHEGIFRGMSALVSLHTTDPDRALIQPKTLQHVAVGDFGSKDDSRPAAYPGSLMGTLAVIRQTWLDAVFQSADRSHFAQNPKQRPRPSFDPGLEALQPTLMGTTPVLFEPTSVLMVDRAAHLAREFGLKPLFLATGQEWRRLDLMKQTQATFIVPLDFPELPKMPSEDDWAVTPYDRLSAWDHAPSNPALLNEAGLALALTTYGLLRKSTFHTQVKLAIARGLPADVALAALTTVPARIFGVEDQLGTLEAGKLANLTIFEEGRVWDSKARLREVWIEGQPFPAALRNLKRPLRKESREKLTAAPAQRDRGPLLEPQAIYIQNATIWTSGPQGKLDNADLLITDGKVRAIGKVTEVPANAHRISLPGIHVSPGLIDCHSHSMIMGGVNEGTLPSTAMVRVADVINSESDTLHQQLAGGLTTANQLHGSANPIGGQNCVIKLREGEGPEGLKLKGAPGGIKFALGENVKQANWGDSFKNRFPQSRMGVPVFHQNRFFAAQQYQTALAEAEKAGRPFRRDLELETLSEILQGKRLIHCHSYRQDEILAFLRVMEGFRIKVGTLQHILEGYKVADEIAAHGAGASAFSDWWAYKYEVMDAIPAAGSIMHERGVVVSFNSDSSDHARRLNLEAAKAVKYGGTREEDALQFVTLNPAKQLRIDHQVGSLEPGKDADFVIWSGHPLSTRSLCLQTWIEGKLYFEREAALARAARQKANHDELLAKAKKLSSESTSTSTPSKAQSKFFLDALEKRQNHLCVDCCLDRQEKASH